MTSLDPAVPPYLRIVGEIRARISTGELRPGDRVPSTRGITEEWGVAKATAAKALDTLRDEGLVRVVPRVGTVVAGPAPEPKPTSGPTAPSSAASKELTAARITGAAVAIADGEGLTAVSMRGVANALGAPTMSLYRHIPNKDALTDMMADAVFGEIDYPTRPPEHWRHGLALAARMQWRIYRRHPWLPSLVSLTHPNVQPNIARYAEWTIQRMRALDLDPQTRMMVHFTVANYVRGTATNLEVQRAMDDQTGLSGGEWLTTQLTDDAPERYPHLTQSIAQEPGYRLDLDEHFEFGLRRVLDGIAALLRPEPGA
ncbi:TetR/AcrR family transcriptional regulator C-terminal domain-containing protein [Spiractinospora alimapuensis]|uniref:TetR/AcrR family transcriptional regulator C-terminal domain-containing protein n=1 Tax=Spiractinospora alimapuensis TaxID=2820884 RepID=UPI001F39547D|nr:TetR/AcrR family transcriptional regulator C-terminal domain-containing protein [Spiractinospora alimapuensis]QVQ52326.1 TetR/AcrR family transcriptional regulator C-terminal domain-containing protein [Spiractinospora alimapuensis]